MVHEFQAPSNGVRAHITSLKPNRTEHSPDEWEAAALKSLEKGEKEVSSIEYLDGKPVMRLIGPLFTEESCLQCHASQGYKLGDIRGGISVSVPLESSWRESHQRILPLAMSHAGIWLLGVITLYAGTRRLGSRFVDEERQKPAVAASEDRYRQMFEGNRTVKLIVDPDTSAILHANQAASEFYGYSRDELKQMKIGDIDASISQKDFQQLASAGKDQPGPLICQHKRRSGEMLDVEIHSSPLDLEGKRLLYAIIHDITDRRRAEKDLGEAQKKYHSLFESVTDAIIVFDSETLEIIDVNSAALRLYGYSRDEFLTLKSLDLSTDKQGSRESYQETRDGRSFTTPLRYHRRKDGSVFPVEISRSVFAMKGRTILCGVIRDISDRHSADKASKNAYKDLEKRVEERTAELLETNEMLLAEIEERKRAEQELRNSEERLELALQGADLGIWDWNIHEYQAVANQGAAQILGYSLDEIEPSFIFWKSLLHPDDVQRSVERVLNHLRGCTDYYEDEYRARAKSGEWKWILSRGKVTERDGNGNPLRMTGTYLDITDRKNSQLRVAEANELKEKILTASSVGMGVFNAAGQCILVNDAMGKAVGAPTEQLVGVNFRELGSWKESDLLADAENVLTSGQDSHREIHIWTTFGRELWAESHVTTFKAGGEPHLFEVFNDITDRRRVEESLRFEREQLLSIFESISEVIIVIDPRTYEILYANKFTKDLYQNDLIGGHCYEKLNGFNRPCEHCSKDIVIELKGKRYRWEYYNSVLKKDFLATDRMIRWPDGRDVKFQLAIDITERKRAEQEAEDLRHQLLQAQKMEAIGTLAGGIAHDFNNLLTVVLGFSELLLIGKSERDPSFPDIQKINQAARNGADLVKRILAFSRKTEINPRPLDLNHEIEQVKNLLVRTLPKMIEIELVLSEDLSQVNADPTLVEQMLMNLAVNAKDAMPDRGKLSIGTGNVVLDEEYCRMHIDAEPGDHVLISVSDTGYGMNEETLQHIFEPFYTTKETGQGTGLGLAMVYGIVRQHGGHITCSSEHGKGTTFRIYLPAMKAGAKTERSADTLLPAAGTETILVVDDEETIRILAERILKRSGYTVLAAANGKDALEMYKKGREKISLVILDLMMPVMGGWQCLEELLKIDPGVKVLMASGISDTGQQELATQVGAKGFVEKPYTIGQMLQRIREVLDGDLYTAPD